MYDHQVVVNAGAPASFVDQSLRMSNAVTSGCFGDQTFSKPLTGAAGESSADGGANSSAPIGQHFEAQWDFASTVPYAEQPGLSVVASPDRGDGARMSWVQMADTPSGLEVNFFDYRDEHPQGPASGCGAEDDFFLKTVASGLNRAVPHTIKVTVDFLEGPANDIARVYVDGVFKASDTSWEDYFRYCEVNPTRTVDSILFRTGGTAVPTTVGFGFLIDNLTMTSGPIATITTPGAWLLFPAQGTAYPAQATAYETRVRQPINADGSSNWPKKRGVIPVQFDLYKELGPALLPAIISDLDPGNDSGFLRFTPASPIAFDQIQTLKADYSYVYGDCIGGAVRWQVRIDVGADGVTGNDANLFIYYGAFPNFDDCSGANGQVNENMVGRSDARYDLGQFFGPFYGTYADALAMIGNLPVLRASLVNDTFGADSLVKVNNATFNDMVFTPQPESTMAKTCNLPEAGLRWSKGDPWPDGGVNEAESIQPKDTGKFYRIVDCKYIYNLDVSSLDSNLVSRGGTYQVGANIDGVNVATPAKFDLR